MDFADRLKDFAARASAFDTSTLQSEGATKNALVLPFIQALGYDVFDPREVVPEFTADVGTKKNEKVDYAILREGLPVIVIECKSLDDSLNSSKCNQLLRYFTATPARIGVLTDGMRYLFFTDLEKQNLMDSKPFMEIDLRHLEEDLLPELKKLSKSNWDLEATLSAASELKYYREIKKLLQAEYDSPTEALVVHFARQVYPGHIVASVKERFKHLVQEAFRQFIDEKANELLQSAIAGNRPSKEAEAPAETEAEEEEGAKVITTEEEWQAFFMVKAMLRGAIDPARVIMRDTRSYCGILLDDNNRKPICRLHFNRAKKYVSFFDENKKEERVAINTLDDILSYADRLKKTVEAYAAAPAQ